MRGLGRHYELVVRVRGEVDATTGYLVNIKEIDQAVRAAAVPLITEACRTRPETDPAALMPGVFGAVRGALRPETVAVRLCLSPYYSVEMEAAGAGNGVVLLRQRFDFAASHRLHVPALSEGENRALFGKCNNPSGHGHNYQFEPCVEVRAGAGSGGAGGNRGFGLQELEAVAQRVLIERYDHKNLSADLPEFRTGEAGVNASVEQIARVFYERLAPAIGEASGGLARLRHITVWETDRTSSTYPG
jgi:6-pyruvoyltetrahydropterin/6-carboxytetrahydropterin synthase